jgi:HD-like signal output (HDOD) protein
MATALRTPAAPASTPAPRALDAAVAKIRSADDFPAVSGRIQQLRDVLGDEDVSVQRLANLIIQDYSLTVKLLRIANSFKFNRSGTPVVSVTHAIVMMGTQPVRDLVSTIVVWEHYRRRSPGLRPLLMLSLLSANHAREIAARTGVARHEEAYLLGMLRNLGEVLVACYLPDEYAKVLKDIADTQCAESVSCRRVLHFEYEELARAVVLDWRMPESVAQTLYDPRSTEHLHKVVSFAHGLTAAVYRHAKGSSHQAVKLLLQKYPAFDLTHDELAKVLEVGVAHTSETFAQAGVQLNDLQLKHQMMAAIVENPESVTQAHQIEPETPTSPDELVVRLQEEVKLAIEDERIELNKAILIILEATLTAGKFDRAVLALVSATRRELCARLALGRVTEDFIARFRYQLGTTGGPIGVAVTRGLEVTVARSWELLPDEQRLVRALDAGALFVAPLVLGGRTIGALYVDTISTAQPSEASIAIAREMRDAIVKAMVKRQPSA